MAVIDRAVRAAQLYRMEYDQTSHPFLQRTNTAGTVDATIIGISSSELGHIHSLPMGSGLNTSGPYYMHNQLIANPSHAGENGSLFLGVAGENQSPAGIPALSQTTCQLGQSRKHKRQEDSNNCPLKKRRVSAPPSRPLFQESQASGVFAGGSGQPFWASIHPPVKETAMVPKLTERSSTMMLPVPAEDMEDVAVESQSDAALRRIRDIESRLVVEEDEDGDNTTDGHLPILVMSDVLVEGFKKGLDECLTKKIVDSINRPSMELVLWKPQPKFLVNKFQTDGSNRKNNKTAGKKIQSTPIMPLLQEVTPLGVDEPCTSNLDCDIEEMEL